MLNAVKHLAGRRPHPGFLAKARNDISNVLRGQDTIS